MTEETTAAQKAATSPGNDGPFAVLAALKQQDGQVPVVASAALPVTPMPPTDGQPSALPVVEPAACETTPVEATPEVAPAKKWALVTHRNQRSACTDALLCLWFMLKFVVKKNEYSISFVRAGERLAKDEEEAFMADDCEIVYLDTGGGECDQHGKKLERSSSFELTCQKYKRQNEPGLQVMLELSRKSDNVEEIDPTSIHYQIRGLPSQFRDKETREVDWQKVIDFAFIMFDIQYRRDTIVETNRRTYLRRGTPPVELKSGIKLAVLINHPEWRDAAYEAGADVVLWTVQANRHDKDSGLNVGIQKHRKAQAKVNLKPVIAHLREAEMHKRRVKASFTKMDCDGMHPQVPGWFLHDSENLILCGSDTMPLMAEEFTTLNPSEMALAVQKILGHVEVEVETIVT